MCQRVRSARYDGAKRCEPTHHSGEAALKMIEERATETGSRCVARYTQQRDAALLLQCHKTEESKDGRECIDTIGAAVSVYEYLGAQLGHVKRRRFSRQ